MIGVERDLATRPPNAEQRLRSRFGWDATVHIFEAPNPGMNVTLTER